MKFIAVPRARLERSFSASTLTRELINSAQVRSLNGK